MRSAIAAGAKSCRTDPSVRQLHVQLNGAVVLRSIN